MSLRRGIKKFLLSPPQSPSTEVVRIFESSSMKALQRMSCQMIRMWVVQAKTHRRLQKKLQDLSFFDRHQTPLQAQSHTSQQHPPLLSTSFHSIQQRKQCQVPWNWKITKTSHFSRKRRKQIAWEEKPFNPTVRMFREPPPTMSWIQRPSIQVRFRWTFRRTIHLMWIWVRSHRQRFQAQINTFTTFQAWARCLIRLQAILQHSTCRSHIHLTINLERTFTNSNQANRISLSNLRPTATQFTANSLRLLRTMFGRIIKSGNECKQLFCENSQSREIKKTTNQHRIASCRRPERFKKLIKIVFSSRSAASCKWLNHSASAVVAAGGGEKFEIVLLVMEMSSEFGLESF